MDALLILQRAVNLISWSGNHPVPSPPGGVSATGGNGQVTVTWNTGSGATSYNLYYSTTTGITKTSGTKISGVTSPKLVTGLSNGVVYYIVVTAVNVGGESALSSPEITVAPVAGPPPVTYPLNGNCGNSTLQGTWYESTGTAHSHIPLQLQFVNAGAMGGTVYGYTGQGALAYSFEEDPTMCGSIMFTDGAQNLVSSYPYTVSTCELTLTYWGRTYHYCRGGVGNCTSCSPN